DECLAVLRGIDRAIAVRGRNLEVVPEEVPVEPDLWNERRLVEGIESADLAREVGLQALQAHAAPRQHVADLEESVVSRADDGIVVPRTVERAPAAGDVHDAQHAEII